MLKKGFTLVEVIVVISVLAVLLSILLPALQKTRENANTVVCSSNLKQLTTVMLLYETENERFPYSFKADIFNKPPGDFIGYLTSNLLGWWWQNYIESYVKQIVRYENIVKCPSRNIKKTKLKEDLLCSNYGVNMSVCKKYSIIEDEFKGTPLSLKSMPSPSKTVLLLDSGYNMINYQHASAKILASWKLKDTIEDLCYVPGAEINENKKLWPGQEFDAISGRHLGKKINTAFTDGHVEKNNADSFVVENTELDYKTTPLWTPR